MSDAIPFVFRKFTMLVDGTIRLTVDVEPFDASGVFKVFNEPNVHGAMVRLTDETEGDRLRAGNAEVRQLGDGNGKDYIDVVEAVQADAVVKVYGEEARQLKLSGFFRCQSVWKEVGTDTEFLAWVRTQKCVVCGTMDADEYGALERCQAAHVRRIANGAGTSIKPAYSAVPMCAHHHQEQHQKGESAVGGKEFLDKARVDHVERWAWDLLKADLGFKSWRNVPPEVLARWASDHCVTQFLPDCYKEALHDSEHS